MKHRFLDLVQLEFLDAQMAEKGFAWNFDP
jgi:hypothetical protein